jgi:signal transduction histidine kinase
MMLIRITDTGPGIAAERLASIFEPFVQLDQPSVPRTQHGVGLGLPIARTLARRTGGDLLVESQVGQGTTFTVVLPTERTSDVAGDNEVREPEFLAR